MTATLTGHVLQVVWPILDPHRTTTQLQAEAAADLEVLAEQAHAVIAGVPRWDIRDAQDMPGWRSYPGLLLVATCPAEPDGSARWHGAAGPTAALPEAELRELVDAGATDTDIGARLASGRETGRKVRRKYGIPAAADLARLQPTG